MTTRNGKALPGTLLASIEQERDVESETDGHNTIGDRNEVLVNNDEPEEAEVDPNVTKK